MPDTIRERAEAVAMKYFERCNLLGRDYNELADDIQVALREAKYCQCENPNLREFIAEFKGGMAGTRLCLKCLKGEESP